MKPLDNTRYVALGYQLDIIDQVLDTIGVVSRVLEAEDSPLASVLMLASSSASAQMDIIRSQNKFKGEKVRHENQA